MKKLIVIILLVASAFVSYAEVQEWYKLKDNETYVEDFLLSAGKSKEVTIYSTEPIQISFLTDAAYAENSSVLYRELSDEYGYEVVKFSNISAGESISTIWGGGTLADPVENKIVIEVTNLIDKDFKVVIYTEEEKKNNNRQS